MNTYTTKDTPITDTVNGEITSLISNIKSLSNYAEEKLAVLESSIQPILAIYPEAAQGSESKPILQESLIGSDLVSIVYNLDKIITRIDDITNRVRI